MEATVKHNYEAKEPDELTLRKGDIIKNIKVLKGGWWEGTLNNKCGVFPDNFVELLDDTTNVAKKICALPGSCGRKWCKVLFGREPLKLDELKLVPQDLIEFFGEQKKGWYRGQLRGHVGIFRSNFVTRPIPEEHLYKALYSYEAADEDELTIAKDEIITLLTKDVVHEGWWKGELNKKVGFFPSNYVASLTDVINGEQEPNPEQKFNLPKIPAKRCSGNTEKKGTTNHSITSNLKDVVGDGSKEGSNESAAIAVSKELDVVVRNVDVQLTHLTASRAKPLRRTPTTKATRTTNTNINMSTKWYIVDEENTNDDKDDLQTHKKEAEVEHEKEDKVKNDDHVKKTRRKAPWADEVILHYLEKQKKVTSEVEKQKEEEIKVNTDDGKIKPEEEEKIERETPIHDSVPLPPEDVLYNIYNELLEKVRLLEENQLNLQRMANQLIQMTPNSNVQINSNESISNVDYKKPNQP